MPSPVNMELDHAGSEQAQGDVEQVSATTSAPLVENAETNPPVPAPAYSEKEPGSPALGTPVSSAVDGASYEVEQATWHPDGAVQALETLWRTWPRIPSQAVVTVWQTCLISLSLSSIACVLSN